MDQGALTGLANRPRGWQFWIDRGGTFTDVVARRPDGVIVTHKLLSVHPGRYRDAAIQGTGISSAFPLVRRCPSNRIDAVKLGTTVATNALLERRGEPTALVITRGMGDLLRIGYQNRPRIFARSIVLPPPLYDRVIEADERVTVNGRVLTSFDPERLRPALEAAHEAGIRAVAIVFMHAYAFPEHERLAADSLAQSGSHRCRRRMRSVRS